MKTQFIATMRNDFAALYAADRAALDPADLLAKVSSAEIIGPAGYSMRIAVAANQIAALRRALKTRFIVEPDHVLETFGTATARACEVALA